MSAHRIRLVRREFPEFRATRQPDARHNSGSGRRERGLASGKRGPGVGWSPPPMGSREGLCRARVGWRWVLRQARWSVRPRKNSSKTVHGLVDCTPGGSGGASAPPRRVLRAALGVEGSRKTSGECADPDFRGEIRSTAERDRRAPTRARGGRPPNGRPPIADQGTRGAHRKFSRFGGCRT